MGYRQMKIAVCSDIHLEFGPLELTNDDGVDALVLSGDICVAADLGKYDALNLMGENTRSSRFHQFFEMCSERFPHVIYVMGNHEHYHGDYALSYDLLCKHLGHLKNLHILDRGVVQIKDITFIGGTLWTDMNKEDPLTLYQIKSMMNDFKTVKNSGRVVSFKKDVLIDKPIGMSDGEFLALPTSQRFKQVFTTRAATFCPEDAVEDHKKMIEYIRLMIEGKFDEKFVVCGHHAPSRKSTHPRYRHDELMNGGYSSHLDEFIMDHPQIKLWTHGHTHEDFDYMIGETRIVCNPRGYIGYEPRANSFRLKVVEV